MTDDNLNITDEEQDSPIADDSDVVEGQKNKAADDDPLEDESVEDTPPADEPITIQEVVDESDEDLLTVAEAKEIVEIRKEELEDAIQDLKIAEQRLVDYKGTKVLVEQLKIKIKEKDAEIARLNKLSKVKNLTAVKAFSSRIHEHLLGNETLYDDELETYLEVLQSI